MHKTVGCLEGQPAGNSRVNTYLLIEKIKRYMDSGVFVHFQES